MVTSSLSSPVKDTKQTISAFALIVFLISGVVLSGLGSWLIWTSPKKIEGLGFVQDNIVVGVAGAYFLTLLLINLMGWLGLGWPWKRQDLIRINLIFIGILLGWVAVVFWVSVNYGFMQGPSKYLELFIPLALFTAISLFLWATAFLLPEKLPLWFGILFLLLIIIFFVSGAYKLFSGYFGNLSNNGQAFFPETALTLLVGFILLLSLLTVPVMLLSLSLKDARVLANMSTRFGSLKLIFLPVIIWIIAVIALLPMRNDRLMVAACIIPLLVLCVVVIYRNMRLWLAKNNRPEATSIISLNSFVIGLLLCGHAFFLLAIGKLGAVIGLTLLVAGLFFMVAILVGGSLSLFQGRVYGVILCLLALVAISPRSLFWVGHYRLAIPSFFNMILLVLLVALSLVAIWLGWYREQKATVPWHSAVGKV